MTNEEQNKLADRVKTVELMLGDLVKVDRFLFKRDIELLPGRKIRGFIYAGTSDNPPPGWTVSLGAGGSAGQNTVTHNLGTTNYAVLVTVIGSTNETFEVGVANITSTAFNVYTSNGTSLVARAFSFMVIPL